MDIGASRTSALPVTITEDALSLDVLFRCRFWWFLYAASVVSPIRICTPTHWHWLVWFPIPRRFLEVLETISWVL